VCYGQSVIIQRYINNPLLLDGYKFDLRIYVLVTSFEPLEAFIYDEGFVRVCTLKYSTEAIDLNNLFIHLTNSSIQRLGPNGAGSKATAESISRHKADIDEAGGTKLSLSYLWRRLKAQGTDVESIQYNMKLLIMKSLVACAKSLSHQPNNFELFGYDVMIDENLRPWLIEINSSPSMAQDNQLDVKIKRKLIADTVRLVNPLPHDRAALLEVLKRRAAEMEQNRLRPFSQHQDEQLKEQDKLNRDLTAIFHGRKPRKHGELPEVMGSFERLCPDEKVYEHIQRMLKQNRPSKQPKQSVKKKTQSRKPSGSSSTIAGRLGKGGLQFLADGCNINL
jgi:tubulin polyglutamylase TTLL5